MLLYYNRSFSRLIAHRHGSIFLRPDSLAISFFLAGWAALLQHLIEDNSKFATVFPHHYAMLSLGGVVGFAIIFRTTLGWGRYWEACTMLHTMYSKWCDTFMQLIAFASVSAERNQSLGTEEGEAKAELLENAAEEIYRNFTTLSAVAADRLSHGDTARMEKRTENSAHWSEQLVSRELLRGGPDLTGFSKMPTFIESVAATSEADRPRRSSYSEQKRMLKTASMDSQSAWDSLQRQVSDSSQMSVSSRLSQMKKSSKARGTLEITNAWHNTYIIRTLPSETQMKILEGSPDRTAMLMYLIIHELSGISNDLDAAPPIQSRMYQQLSEGMVGFAQACKLSDVPFPFPYAQMLTLLLLCYGIFIPIYVTAFTNSMVAGPIISFALFQGFWGLNETAKELENPFGPDPNDIVLSDFHMRFMDELDQVFFVSTLRSQARRRSAAASRDRGSTWPVNAPMTGVPSEPAETKNVVMASDTSDASCNLNEPAVHSPMTSPSRKGPLSCPLVPRPFQPTGPASAAGEPVSIRSASAEQTTESLFSCCVVACGAEHLDEPIIELEVAGLHDEFSSGLMTAVEGEVDDECNAPVMGEDHSRNKI